MLPKRETQLLFLATETPEQQDGYLVGSMRQQDREVSFLHSNQDLKTKEQNLPKPKPKFGLGWGTYFLKRSDFSTLAPR